MIFLTGSSARRSRFSVCADFVVERSVIVELKAMEAVADLHRAQLLSYLRLSGLKLGLLINFHAFPGQGNPQDGEQAMKPFLFSFRVLRETFASSASGNPSAGACR